MIKLIIFTDLDGTLLDHHDYSFEPARAALERIRAAGFPLIINSSKTLAEIVSIRSALQNTDPFIVENGGAIVSPPGMCPDASRPYVIETLGADHETIRRVLQSLRADEGFRFRGMSDMTTSEVAELTGLSLDEAAKAKDRLCSEPLVWEDSQAARVRFTALIEAQHLRLVQGGRFLHVMGDTDKAIAMEKLTARYRESEPDKEIITVALGDSPNDSAMLDVADIAVVIPAANGTQLKPGAREVIYPSAPGPTGWNQAMNPLLDRFGA
ncbi:MAG: HAD-IIB family hydrolase [Pseudomonadota bacterium]|nr:HAD-IIB family hydrolase [Pseudomonadota bacterium]